MKVQGLNSPNECSSRKELGPILERISLIKRNY
jgi:hypothetical protein